MISVLIKQGAQVIEKRDFTGDDNANLDIIAKLQAASPLLKFEVHSDADADWGTAFDSVVVAPLQTPEQAAWQTAKSKGTDAAVAFLGKRLGLE